ncbi:MAG: hypothetical protein Q8O36_04825 [Candidatus Omnitrophota bacterium]|nr:hypothetical protein [Candidatus Omnitrophota bacterium]
MAIDLYIRRVRNTPYKLVLSREQIIGMFDHNKYISKANMKDKHKYVMGEVMKSDIVTQNGIER